MSVADHEDARALLGGAQREQFMRTVRGMAADFTLDRSAGQKTRLVVDCEAAGMVPQLERVAHPFSATVISSGGFEPKGFAAGLADHDRPTEVLDIGDHDPSGAHMCLAHYEDIEAFVRDLGGTVTISRLAVTPEQIAAYDLPTAPPKPTDRRAFAGQTCQAEALAPDVLASILRDAIKARIGGRIRYRRADVEAFVEAHVRSRADGAPFLPTGSAARMVSQPREREAEAGKTK